MRFAQTTKYTAWEQIPSRYFEQIKVQQGRLNSIIMWLMHSTYEYDSMVISSNLRLRAVEQQH